MNLSYTTPAPLTADRRLVRKCITLVTTPDTIARAADPVLPEGYFFRMYRPGDMLEWARLMTVVEEFDSEEKGVEFFQREYLPYEDELKQRQVYICAPNGTPVATSMAWYFEENGVRYGRLHWVCTDPRHQGKGLGRAVVTWAMKRIAELEPGLNVYLDTQTWSHKALGLYMRLGFHPVRDTHPVLRHANEYSAAAEILKDVLPEETYRMYIENSVE